MVVRAWRGLNRMRWYWRRPLKVAVFAIVVLVVLFPKFWLIPRTIARYGDMNSVLDPAHPELAPLEDKVRQAMPPETDARGALLFVQQAVYERIPYAWDWEVWGVAEYLPTVAEVFEKGREDCDGRAVVAASLLRRMGYEAWLVSDLLHVWVKTPAGETMSPSVGEMTLVGTETGTRTKASFKVLGNLGRGLSYGVAVFPLTRELIMLAALCVLAMQPCSSFWRRVAGCLLLWIALDLMRGAGQQAALFSQTRHWIQTWSGVALTATGWLILVIRAGDPLLRRDADSPE